MNEKLTNALKFGHEKMIELGLKPVVAVSSLLELFVFNELISDGEADFFINGDDLTPEIEDKIKKANGFHQWKQFNNYEGQRTIFYFHDPIGIHITFVPYYIRGNKTYVNLINDKFFVWDKKHFDTLQTKTYQHTMYNIPYDPIGYLETYYGKPWDDFEGRKGWHWNNAKNLQTLKGLPCKE
jgi:hypothetical protein